MVYQGCTDCDCCGEIGMCRDVGGPKVCYTCDPTTPAWEYPDDEFDFIVRLPA